MTKTIAIIDDDLDFLEWLKIGLKMEEYNVITATTGKDGLNLVRDNKIDLIILDIILTDINGFDIIKKLKAGISTSKIPVIAVTGFYKEAEYVQKGYETGVDDFLLKPFSYELLSVKIKKILGTLVTNE